MKVQVRLLAGLRDRLGREALSVEVTRGTRAAEMPGKVFRDGGLSPDEWARIRYAVNMEYASSDKELLEGDEVAMLPPVPEKTLSAND